MKIINASYEILYIQPLAIEKIEEIARTCYKSEDKIKPDSASQFVRRIRDRGHFAMFDHISTTVKFIVDRGVSHELVRHRIAAYAQESTRYCNYNNDRFGNELTFIKPCFWKEDSIQFERWSEAMKNAEESYIDLIKMGCPPQQARSVLPNSLKTEIIATLDFTSWRHVFKLRTSMEAHPQMREVMIPLLSKFIERWPEVFDDL